MQGTEDGSGAAALLYTPIDAVLWVVVLSVLLTAIEVPWKAKTGLRACLNPGTLAYLIISVVGYTATTFLAASIVGTRIAGSPLFWHVFFGVFGFHILLRQTNVTVFDKGVLTIHEWVQKALEQAMASSVDRDLDRRQEAAIRVAGELRNLPRPDLNGYVERYLGAGSVAELEREAGASGSDPAHYLALALAQEKPREAAAIQRGRR